MDNITGNAASWVQAVDKKETLEKKKVLTEKEVKKLLATSQTLITTLKNNFPILYENIADKNIYDAIVLLNASERSMENLN